MASSSGRAHRVDLFWALYRVLLYVSGWGYLSEFVCLFSACSPNIYRVYGRDHIVIDGYAVVFSLVVWYAREVDRSVKPSNQIVDWHLVH